ncbi:MAG: hypothetical protein WC975_08245 [Phycisphaerae bacterium]
MFQKEKTLSVVVITGLPVIFFAPLFFTCGLGPMEDDLIQYFPYLAWLEKNLAAGFFPLWNRLAYGGYPAIGDPQSGMFYPLNWLSGLIGAGLAYPMLLIVHYWIAGAGMYRLGRAWKLARLSAMTGAVAWMFSGFMLGHRTHYSILAAASWMSLIFYFWTKLRQGNKCRKYFVIVVVLEALQIVAGHVQVAALSGAAVFLYLLVTSDTRRFRWILVLGSSYVLAFGLAAVQLLPVWHVYADSVRTANSYRFVTENSFLPVAWPLVIAPSSMGLRVPNFLYEYKYFGPWNHCELLCFTTIVCLALACFAVRNMKKHHRLILFFLILSIFSVFLAMGRYNPVFKLLFYIPIFRPFRCPARYLIWFNFSVAVLAMIGMEYLSIRTNLARFRKFAAKITTILAGGFVVYLVVIYWVTSWFDGKNFLPESLSEIPKSILLAIHPSNPGIFIPLIISAGLISICLFLKARWLARGIFVLLVIEIATFAPFYDIYFDKVGKVNLFPSVAKKLDVLNPERDGSIWPLSKNPYANPLETLEPFCNMLVDRPTITGYGPLLNKYQRRLFGWELWPTTEQYLGLLSRNDLLNRYGIRYIVADAKMGKQIDALKAFRSDGKKDFKEFFASFVNVNPSTHYGKEVFLDRGLYRLDFHVRRTTEDQLRLFISFSGLQNALWSDQQLSLTTWDVDKNFRKFQWYFFIPARQATKISFHADYGASEFKNIQLSGVSFNLDYLKSLAGNSADGIRIYENINWPGQGFFAKTAKMVDSRMKAIDQILFFGHTEQTYLVSGSGLTLPSVLGRGRILEFKEGLNSIYIRVAVKERSAVFVIPAGFDSGWQVRVDNRETNLLCADGISRAVVVPVGEHEITLNYMPRSLMIGAGITVFSGLILMTIFLAGTGLKMTKS